MKKKSPPVIPELERYLIKQGFHTESVKNSVLTIAIDELDTPFMFVLENFEGHKGLVLSVAVDFFDCALAMELTIAIMHLAPVVMGESFYCTDEGIYYGAEAQRMYNLNNLNLAELDVTSKDVH